MEPTTAGKRVLLVEDSPSLAVIYAGYLSKIACAVTSVDTGALALETLRLKEFDLVLLDLKLPDMDGMAVLKELKQNKPHIDVVIITAHGSVDIAITAMQLGAADFISKPFDEYRLNTTVKNLLSKLQLNKVVKRYEETFERQEFHRFVGRSLEMQLVYRIIESAANSKATVFIVGASGTGKELCADAIHHESKRKDKPFVALNCAAIPRDLMESEIFGHVKGAFTGAVSRREGAASRAHRGTLFLDEICEMDIELQSKLLRFIQTGRFQRVGDTSEEEVDIRIVCATNRDPAEEVSAGRFREDLYYRLNVIPITLPPLKDRGDDILLLTETLLGRISEEEGKEFKGLSAEVKAVFRAHNWPGNVRELENVLRNIVVLNQADRIELGMLPAIMRDGGTVTQEPAGIEEDSEIPAAPRMDEKFCDSNPQANDQEIRPLWLAEKEIIERAVSLCGDNIAKAASYLEISPSTIYRKRASWEKALARLVSDQIDEQASS